MKVVEVIKAKKNGTKRQRYMLGNSYKVGRK